MLIQNANDLDSLIALQTVVSRGKMKRLDEGDLEALCPVADSLGMDLAGLVGRYGEFEI